MQILISILQRLMRELLPRLLSGALCPSISNSSDDDPLVYAHSFLRKRHPATTWRERGKASEEKWRQVVIISFSQGPAERVRM